jgi:hypothetical protein
MAKAIVSAEEDAKRDKPKKALSAAELHKKAKEQETDGLCDPVSLEIFSAWYAFGGAQRGLSPQEILSMPAWLRQDFLLIMTYISDERDRVKRNTPKPVKARKHL